MSATTLFAPKQTTKPQNEAKYFAHFWREKAAVLEPQIADRFAERQENTPRRRQMADMLRAEGEILREARAVMLELADLHEQNNVPAPLVEINLAHSIQKIVGDIHIHSRHGSLGALLNRDDQALAVWRIVNSLKYRRAVRS